MKNGAAHAHQEFPGVPPPPLPAKETTVYLARYSQIFENFFSKVFFPFNFAPAFSRILKLNITHRQKFNNSRTSCKLSWKISVPFTTVSTDIFESFGRMERAQCQ